MILADTSVWIDHFRSGNDHLSELIEKDRIVCHQLVIGELSCGNIRNRKEILDQLQKLTVYEVPDFREVLYFIEQNNLFGKGLGWIDISLLVSVIINDIELWTLDKRLKFVANDLSIIYKH